MSSLNKLFSNRSLPYRWSGFLTNPLSFDLRSSVLASTRMQVVVAQLSSPSLGAWAEKEAQSISRSSLEQMRIYVKRHASIYNFKSASATMMQYLLQPTSDCLKELHLQDSCEIFELCSGGLQQLLNGHFLVQAITQAIRALFHHPKS